jgi:hypothetical protein
MQIKKILQRQLKAIPILYIMIVLIWGVVFAVVAYHYFHGFSNSAAEETSQRLSEKNYLNTSTIKLSYLDSDFINNLASDTQDQLLNEKKSTLENLDLQFNTLYTELGVISSVYDNDTKNYMLFLNNVPLGQVANPLIKYGFRLHNKQVILIFEVEKVGDNSVYTILDLSLKNKRILHEVGDFEELKAATLSNDQLCVYLKFNDTRKYSKNSDYQLYQYCGTGGFNKILNVKSEEYYQRKFAGMNSEQIIKLAEHDKCYDSKTQHFYLDHRCSYGIKYCHIFKLIKVESDNSNYRDLEHACAAYAETDVLQSLRLN